MPDESRTETGTQLDAVRAWLGSLGHTPFAFQEAVWTAYARTASSWVPVSVRDSSGMRRLSRGRGPQSWRTGVG